MKLFIGLGNPGKDYENTRHNAGFLVADELSKKTGSSKVKILKSDKFMNESGEFVNKIIKRYPLKSNELFIIHDDLDIKLGEFKIQFGRGPKDHNGIKSVDNALETKNYWHVRVGVDNRPSDNRPMGEEYVLQEFTDEEWNVLNKTIKNIVNTLL